MVLFVVETVWEDNVEGTVVLVVLNQLVTIHNRFCEVFHIIFEKLKIWITEDFWFFWLVLFKTIYFGLTIYTAFALPGTQRTTPLGQGSILWVSEDTVYSFEIVNAVIKLNHWSIVEVLRWNLGIYLLSQYLINFIILRIVYSQCFYVEWVVLHLNGFYLSLSLFNQFPSFDYQLLLTVYQQNFWEYLNV